MDYELRFIVGQKEEDFNTVCFESSKPHEQGSQDSNNAETKVKPSNVLRETDASTVRVNPGLLEKQKRQQRRQQQSYVNTSENEVLLHIQEDLSRGQNLDNNSRTPDVHRRDSHLQVCLLRHHDEQERKR